MCSFSVSGVNYWRCAVEAARGLLMLANDSPVPLFVDPSLGMSSSSSTSTCAEDMGILRQASLFEAGLRASKNVGLTSAKHGPKKVRTSKHVITLVYDVCGAFRCAHKFDSKKLRHATGRQRMQGKGVMMACRRHRSPAASSRGGHPRAWSSFHLQTQASPKPRWRDMVSSSSPTSVLPVTLNILGPAAG